MMKNCMLKNINRIWLLFIMSTFAFLVSSSYSQVIFSEEIQITPPSVHGMRSVISADLDGDGDLDLVSAAYQDNKIFWLEKEDLVLNFGFHKTISTDVLGAESVFCADLDGDGDLDVLSASRADDKTAWYENIDGLGNFGPQQVISTETDGACSVFSADLDGDGDYDVLAAAYYIDEVLWFENADGLGNFELAQVITGEADGVECVICSDLDGDGDFDVLSASENDDKIAWYENTDGLGSFGNQQVITLLENGANSVFSIDLDGDEDNDVLTASKFDNDIAWYENTDGLGTFELAETINTSADGVMSVFSTDIDNDGDNDVISASEDDNTIAWYENVNGLGTFGPISQLSTRIKGANWVTSADLDGDGDNDILSSSHKITQAGHTHSQINFFGNINGSGNFGPQSILVPEFDDPSSVYCSDIDGDGDNDIVAAASRSNTITWFENVDGIGDFSEQNLIAYSEDNVRSVFCSDLDGDEDLDILSASMDDDNISWHENVDGAGNFNLAENIDANADGAHSVFSADLDGDGDNDVLSASHFAGEIRWYENTDGAGNFDLVEIIDPDAYGAQSVYSADLDGDGDNDVLAAASFFDDEIWMGFSQVAWYENTDGFGTFGSLSYLSSGVGLAKSVCSDDLDGDGDNDVIVASSNDPSVWGDISRIRWFENTDGEGDFGFGQTVTTNLIGPRSVHCSDLDNDGDMDILSASIDDKIAWYENTDGLGSFGTQQVISDNAEWAYSVFSADLDGDGDMDVVSASSGDDKVAWYRNDMIALVPVPPHPFSLLEPDSGSTMNSHEVLLEWEESFDPNNDLAFYRIFLSESPDNLQENYLDSTLLTSYTFQGEDSTQYWWTVSAIDSSGYETWADRVFSFYIEIPAPMPFSLLSPENESVIYSASITLEWEEATDPDNDLSAYRVYISTNPDNLEECYIDSTTLTNFTFFGMNGNRYWWSVKARDEMGNETWANEVFNFTIDINAVNNLNDQNLPDSYELTSIYPNPFNPVTTITIGLPESNFLQVNVFNVLGQQIDVLSDMQHSAGYHSFTLDGSALSSGIYFVRANVPGKLNEIRKVVLMK